MHDRSFIKLIRRLTPALTYAHEHPGVQFSMEALAEMCRLSRSRFDALFKQVMGISPGQYVRQLRMQRAQHMLMTTDKTVEEIALICGFPDQFHFSRMFKKHASISPTAYRRRTLLAGM